MYVHRPKVVVTGGEGFVGCNLVRALLKVGCMVHSVDAQRIDTARVKHPHVWYHTLDIRARGSQLMRIFQGADVVFHQAALARVPDSFMRREEFYSVDVNGTERVLNAAAAARVRRVVFASSSSVYGEQEHLPFHESLSLRPQSPYADFKCMGEQLMKSWARDRLVETVSLRYFNVYGAGMDADSPHVLAIPRFLKQRSRGESITLTGDGSQTRDFTHVSDVIRANVLAAWGTGVGCGDAINIGSGNPVSMKDIAAFIGGRVTHIAPRNEPHDTWADPTRARQLLGWEPRVNIWDGIARLKRVWKIT